ncbi:MULTISPECIES: type IV secretion system protein [Burkholderia]|jgi:type IV secretion system protein VirB6|uniref:TrbL/VirB6 plasmid conjugal transfer protein n=2 Tax=Pseudomonadota TaxID=1224 RepID=B1F9A9_9BURK|nr:MULTISPECIES: type IV secretion system protein [Burkholderia]EDT05881.1 TrbL/VirB6 plasmid conjugal transfer protein [Burkholderia ambifaria IOP40-10]MBJ9920564.1 type IV secretion system protein [Burkholderia cenocepacia]MCA3785202.1 type IV secretion system protein [Burkholderia sp.]MCA3793075.1 type IV secretion system protein [Burkholderia sp.]MCA3804955.1 type IV secretion system protein [Burkholderia sp.]
MQLTIFTDMFNAFDKDVLNTISTGSAKMISLISPLVAAGFSLYVLLILVSYWRGHENQPIVDFLLKMAAWAAVLTAGMNIGYYSEYVVPFFNGLGDDLSRALMGGNDLSNGLDTLLSLYFDAIKSLYEGLSITDIGLYIEVSVLAACIILVGVPFLAIAAAYIILAKFALGLLLALGPAFVVAALFPATRQFFQNWVGQCLNYGILVALFGALGAIEVRFMTSVLPTSFSAKDVMLTYAIEGKIVGAGLVFIVVSLSMPSLASQLAGGVGISSMVGKIGNAASAAMKAMKLMGGGRGGASAAPSNSLGRA